MNFSSRNTKVVIAALVGIFVLALQTKGTHAVIDDEIAMITAAAPDKAPATPKTARRLLVFSLAEGDIHSSIQYCAKAIEIMGKKTGAYSVIHSKDMDMFKPESLNHFDAILLNNTTRLEFSDPELQQSLMAFVKSGKGIIGIHAAIDNFYQWTEAAQMMGGRFSGHLRKKNGTWSVKVDTPGNRIVADFDGSGFTINDAIYLTKAPLYSRANQLVLLSIDRTDEANLDAGGVEAGEVDIGVSWIKEWGDGRVFYSALGHNDDDFWNPAVLRHFLAGIQYALGDLEVDATPRKSQLSRIEELLRQIKGYEYGQTRVALTEINDIIRSLSGDHVQLAEIEREFDEFIVSDASFTSKHFVCGKLRIIGTEKSLPALATLLADPKTADMARYALEPIAGAAVDKVLLSGLETTSTETKIGIINSLGQRKTGAAIAAISTLLYDQDALTAERAAAALGQIANSEAAEALAKAAAQTSGSVRISVLDGRLRCADSFAGEGEKEKALTIYRELFAEDYLAVRIGALVGMVAVDNKNAGGFILEVLKGDNAKMQSAVISLVKYLPDASVVEVSGELYNLPTKGQVQLITVLADRGGPGVFPIVVKATKSSAIDVRISAISALGKLGDASAVELLAQTAATAKSDEQKAARKSLYALNAVGVNERIIEHISSANANVKVELIRSTSERDISTAVATLLEQAENKDRKVRRESYRALKTLADESALGSIVDLLVNIKGDYERMEAERCVAAVAGMIGDSSKRSDIMLTALKSTKNVDARCSLLRVLGKIGGAKSLHVLREALSDKEAAVQKATIYGLSAWPDSEPLADLRQIAIISNDKTNQVLALRGYVRMIGLDKADKSKKVEMYAHAISLASEIGEKRLVLSGLSNVNSVAALKMAAGYLDDQSLVQEAVVAAVQIAWATYLIHGQETRTVLEQVAEVATTESWKNNAKFMLGQINEALPKGKAVDVDKVGETVYMIGNDFSNWRQPTGSWQEVGAAEAVADKERALTVREGTGTIINSTKTNTVDLISNIEFGDVRAHIEFMVPRNSNSGVYFMGRYEIQIRDSWGRDVVTYQDCGAIYESWDETRPHPSYGGFPPRVNASRAPGEWQEFDVIFRAPRFDKDGKKIADAKFVKIVHNGVVIHENQEVGGPTVGATYVNQPEKPTGPVMLQGDHGAIAYRNVWFEPLADADTYVEKNARIVYLIGDDLSSWRKPAGTWQVVGSTEMADEKETLIIQEGAGIIVNSIDKNTINLISKDSFSDVRAHIEFMVPHQSNSGIYFMGRYELQILDSWGKETAKYSDAGGIYQRWDESREPKGYEGVDPRVNAARRPGEWQEFDVVFHAPRFDENGSKIANAKFVKVVHNGIVIHENVEVTGPTRSATYEHEAERLSGPVMLQGDHGPVAYRNIWFERLDAKK